jgi:hypothetical protein
VLIIYLTQSTQLVTCDTMGNHYIVHYFKAAFICHFFLLRASLALISCVGVLMSGSVMVFFVFNAKIFLLPQYIPHRENSRNVHYLIQQFALSVINEHLSFMMSLLCVSALQHDKTSLC